MLVHPIFVTQILFLYTSTAVSICQKRPWYISKGRNDQSYQSYQAEHVSGIIPVFFLIIYDYALILNKNYPYCVW